MDNYSLPWLPNDVSFIEQCAMIVRQALLSESPSLNHKQTSLQKRHKTEEKDGQQHDLGLLDDSVQTAGSFFSRTTLRRTPSGTLGGATPAGTYYNLDLIVTIPEEQCTVRDIESGLYLEKRRLFAKRAYNHLQGYPLVQRGEDKTTKSKKSSSSRSTVVAGPMLLPACGVSRYRGLKEALCLVFKSVKQDDGKDGHSHEKNDDDEEESVAKESAVKDGLYVEVRVHFRPKNLPGKVASEKNMQKLWRQYSKEKGQDEPVHRLDYLSVCVLLEDWSMQEFLKQIHDMVSSCPALPVAIRVTTAWAHSLGIVCPSPSLLPPSTSNQLGPLLPRDEGFSTFTTMALFLHLFQTEACATSMSDEQLCRAVLIGLANGAFVQPSTGRPHVVLPTLQSAPHLNLLHRLERPLDLTASSKSEEGTFLPSVFTSVLAPVASKLLSNAVNLGSGGLRATIPSNKFCSFLSRFDLVLRVEVSSASTKEQNSSKQGNFLLRNDESQLHRVVSTALSGRLKSSPLVILHGNVATIGLVFSSELTGAQKLIRGPPVEEEKRVLEFNNFWKSAPAPTSARQFSDGAIYRCVVWPSPVRHIEGASDGAVVALRSAQDTAPLVASILTWALTAHCCQDEDNAGVHVEVTPIGQQAACELLQEPDAAAAVWYDRGPAAMHLLRSAAITVRNALLQEGAKLPCTFTRVEFISQSHRGTEPFPIRPHCSLFPAETMKSITTVQKSAMTFSGSIPAVHAVAMIDDKGKVSSTVEATRSLRSAVVAQIAKFLSQRQVKNDKTPDANGEREFTHVLCSPSFLDVVHQGFLFRFHVVHFKEVSLLRAMGHDQQVAMLERRYFHSVSHSMFVAAAVGASPALATGIRLALRWVGAMLLSDFLLPEAVELLTVYAASSSALMLSGMNEEEETAEPAEAPKGGKKIKNKKKKQQRFFDQSLLSEAPQSPFEVFLRFLRCIATFAFHKQPIVLAGTDPDIATTAMQRTQVSVDGQEQFSDNDSEEGTGEADSWQNSTFGMFIATPYAPEQSPFTANTPRGSIVARLKQCALKALETIHCTLEGHPHHHAASPTDQKSNNIGPLSVSSAIRDAFIVGDLTHTFDAVIVLSKTPSPSFNATNQDVFSREAWTAEGRRIVFCAPTRPCPTVDPVTALLPEGVVCPVSNASCPLLAKELWQIPTPTNAGDQSESATANQLQKYVDWEPFALIVRKIRASVSDALVMYDSFAPTVLGLIQLTPGKQTLPTTSPTKKFTDVTSASCCGFGVDQSYSWSSQRGLETARTAVAAAPPGTVLSLRASRREKKILKNPQLEDDDDVEFEVGPPKKSKLGLESTPSPIQRKNKKELLLSSQRERQQLTPAATKNEGKGLAAGASPSSNSGKKAMNSRLTKTPTPNAKNLSKKQRAES